MTANTYTVVDPVGTPLARGISARDAAAEILSYDGAHYDVRPEDDGDGYVLFVGRRGFPLARTRYFSLAADRDLGEAEIFAEVVASTDFGAEALTDEAFDRAAAGLD